MKSTKSRSPAKKFAGARFGYIAKNGQMLDLLQLWPKCGTSLIAIVIVVITVVNVIVIITVINSYNSDQPVTLMV